MAHEEEVAVKTKSVNHKGGTPPSESEEALATLNAIKAHLAAIEKQTSTKTRAIEGALLVVGVGTVAAGAYALGKWAFGGDPIAVPVTVVPGT